MFALPSISNLVVSIVVFVIAVRYLRNYLDDMGIPKGVTRSTLVFSLASLLSWGSGEVVDWSQQKVQGKPPPASQTSDDISQLLKALNQTQTSAEPK